MSKSRGISKNNDILCGESKIKQHEELRCTAEDEIKISCLIIRFEHFFKLSKEVRREDRCIYQHTLRGHQRLLNETNLINVHETKK